MGRGPGFRGDVALLAIARLPQVAAQVNKTRRNHAATGIKLLGRAGAYRSAAEGLDPAVANQQAGVVGFGAGTVEQGATGNFQTVILLVAHARAPS